MINATVLLETNKRVEGYNTERGIVFLEGIQKAIDEDASLNEKQANHVMMWILTEIRHLPDISKIMEPTFRDELRIRTEIANYIHLCSIHNKTDSLIQV